MIDDERPSGPPSDSGVALPEPPYAREEADVVERTKRGSVNVLSEQEVAELEARRREYRRPYEAPSNQ